MAWENSELSKNEVVSVVKSANTGWDVDVKPLAEECKCSAESKTKIVVSEKTLRQIKTLCSKFPDLEWMAELVGKQEDDGSYVVDELQLFEQEVMGASVEYTSKGNVDKSKIASLGWIHSHNKMGAFLSGTDIKTASFSLISLVVNNEMQFGGKIKKTMPCGEQVLKDVEVFTEFGLDDDIAAKADELIRKSTYITYGKDYGGYKNLEGENWKIGGEAEYCLLCERKVGKKHKKVAAGKIHNKCYERYVAGGNDPQMQELIDDYYLCEDCGMYEVDCNCEKEEPVTIDYRDYSYCG